MTALFFDIETIPSQAADARELARQSVRPPGTLKREDSIAAWHAEHGPAAAEDAYRKMALDPAQGEVCAIGAAVDDGDVIVTVRQFTEGERAFLVRALKAIEAMLAARRPDPADPAAPWFADLTPHPVGFNVAKFDFPFLRMRCWANRIAPPKWLPGPLARAPKDFTDVMMLAAGPTGMISLDKVCRALGVPSPKSNGDGGAVFDLWRSGAHEALATYCAGDVEAVRSVWHIMTGAAVEVAA